MHHISLHIIAITKLKTQIFLRAKDFNEEPIDLSFTQHCLLYSNYYSSAVQVYAQLWFAQVKSRLTSVALAELVEICSYFLYQH